MDLARAKLGLVRRLHQLLRGALAEHAIRGGVDEGAHLQREQDVLAGGALQVEAPDRLLHEDVAEVPEHRVEARCGHL
eukprot:2534094-Prymnesium_polylepis.1